MHHTHCSRCLQRFSVNSRGCAKQAVGQITDDAKHHVRQYFLTVLRNMETEAVPTLNYKLLQCSKLTKPAQLSCVIANLFPQRLCGIGYDAHAAAHCGHRTVAFQCGSYAMLTTMIRLLDYWTYRRLIHYSLTLVAYLPSNNGAEQILQETKHVDWCIFCAFLRSEVCQYSYINRHYGNLNRML